MIKRRNSGQTDASGCKRPYITTKDLGAWRGLGWFWTAILATVSVTASLLQILGPPRSDRGNLAAAAGAAEQASAEPGPAPPIAIAGPPSGESQPANDTASWSVTPADMQMARKPELAALDNMVQTGPFLMKALAPHPGSLQVRREHFPEQTRALA